MKKKDFKSFEFNSGFSEVQFPSPINEKDHELAKRFILENRFSTLLFGLPIISSTLNFPFDLRSGKKFQFFEFIDYNNLQMIKGISKKIGKGSFSTAYIVQLESIRNLVFKIDIKRISLDWEILILQYVGDYLPHNFLKNDKSSSYRYFLLLKLKRKLSLSNNYLQIQMFLFPLAVYDYLSCKIMLLPYGNLGTLIDVIMNLFSDFSQTEHEYLVAYLSLEVLIGC